MAFLSHLAVLAEARFLWFNWCVQNEKRETYNCRLVSAAPTGLSLTANVCDVRATGAEGHTRVIDV